jgi:hypothetical protein
VTVFDASLEVPVIAVFIKYNQLVRGVEIHLEDFPDDTTSEVAEKQFQGHYLRPLSDDVRYVRLESEFRVKFLGYVVRQKCRGGVVRPSCPARRVWPRHLWVNTSTKTLPKKRRYCIGKSPYITGAVNKLQYRRTKMWRGRSEEMSAHLLT